MQGPILESMGPRENPRRRTPCARQRSSSSPSATTPATTLPRRRSRAYLAAALTLGIFLCHTGISDATRIAESQSLSLGADPTDDEIKALLAKRDSLIKDIDGIKKDLSPSEKSGNAGPRAGNAGHFICPPPDYESNYRLMNLITSALGAAAGLVLVFGGVKIPLTSTIIVFATGYGIIGYSIVWFGVVSVQSGSWYDPFLGAYVAAIVFGFIFTLVAAGHMIGSRFSIILGCALGWMIFGIMLNTAGIYRLGVTDLPYYTFSICAGTFYGLGLFINAMLVLFEIAERRYLAMANFSFIGAYLCIKMCGIAADVYPSEFCALRFDNDAGKWQYYLCFVATFLMAALAFVFQLRVYPLTAADDFVEGGALVSRSLRRARKASHPPPLPKHASSRRQFSSRPPKSSRQPQFGGMHAGPHDDSVERFVRNY